MFRKNDPAYAEKIQILYQNIPGAIIPTFAATVVYGGVVWNVLPHSRILIWGFCNFLSVLGRFYLYCRYQQLQGPVQNPEKWFLGVAALTYLSGALWGSTGLFLLPESLLSLLFLSFLLAGFTAGAVAIYSIMPIVVVGFTLLAISPLYLRVSLSFMDNSIQDDAMKLALLVITPIYWIGMMMVSRQIHRAMTRALELNIKLGETQLTLEKRVSERTAELRDANAHLRQLTNAIEQSVEMVVIFNLEGTVEYVNPMVERQSGYSAGELVGQDFQKIWKYGQEVDLSQELFQTVRAGEEWTDEIENITKSGKTYIAEITMSPIYGDDHQMTHFLAIMRDITKRKALEKASFSPASFRLSGC